MGRSKVWPPRIYQHVNGQDYLKVQGRTIYLGRTGTDGVRTRYLEVVASIDAGLSPGPAPASPSITVADLVARFLVDRQASTEKRSLMHAVRPLLHLYATAKVADMSPRHLRAVRQIMLDGYDRFRPQHRRTVNRNVSRLKLLFRWASVEGLMPAELFHRLSLLPALEAAAHEQGVQPVPDADLWRTLPHLSPTLRGMVMVQLASGCRAGEVVRLRWADVDTSQPIWRWTLAAHKNSWRGHGRTIYLAGDAQAALEGFRDHAPDLPLFSPRTNARGHRTDSRAPGDQYAVSTYDRAVARACRRAGVDPWSPGRLRHNAATRFVADYGWEAARILLGHRHVQTTRIYAVDDAERVLRLLAG